MKCPRCERQQKRNNHSSAERIVECHRSEFGRVFGPATYFAEVSDEIFVGGLEHHILLHKGVPISEVKFDKECATDGENQKYNQILSVFHFDENGILMRKGNVFYHIKQQLFDGLSKSVPRIEFRTAFAVCRWAKYWNKLARF